MVDRDGLENRCTLTGTQGSNPCLSASNPATLAGLFCLLPPDAPPHGWALSTSRYTPLSCSAPLPAGHSLPDTRDTRPTENFSQQKPCLCSKKSLSLLPTFHFATHMATTNTARHRLCIIAITPQYFDINKERKYMKNRKLKTFWIYTTCLVLTAIIMFSLNYILKLPAIIPIIGDENTWLPITANAIVSAAIFIAGNWFSNEDRLRKEILAKKEDYKIIRESVCKVQSSLNIKKRQLYFIYSLDANMDSRSLLSEIMQTQQEIEDSINAFEQTKYIITSNSELEEFEIIYMQLKESFLCVLEELMKIVNDWCDTLAKSKQASTVADLIGEHSDKTNYVLLYTKSCQDLEKYKNKLLNTYKSQEKRLDSLLDTLNKSVNNLLNAESTAIKNLESNI